MTKWIISLWYNFLVECLSILDEVYISCFICGLFLKYFQFLVLLDYFQQFFCWILKVIIHLYLLVKIVGDTFK